MESKKVSKGLIIGIIIGFVIVCILGFIFVMLIATKNVNSTISKSKSSSFVETYSLLQKSVKTNIVNGYNATCDDDCQIIYDYDDASFDFEVTDMGSYYKLEFEVDDDKYRGFKFTPDSCDTLTNSVCDENEIIGRVYKD